MAKESFFVKNLWKWIVLAILTAGAVYFVVPPKEKVRLGLDLAGGTRFTLQIDENKLDKSLKEKYDNQYSEKIKAKQDGFSEDKREEWVNSKVAAEKARIFEDSDSRILEIIRRRIDGMGTNEPQIYTSRSDADKEYKGPRFVVELPKATKEESDKAKETLNKMAALEFRLTPKEEQKLISEIPEEKAPLGFKCVGVNTFVRADDYEDVSTNSNYLTEFAKFGLSDRADQIKLKFVLQRDKAKSEDGGVKYKGRYVESDVRLKGEDIVFARVVPSTERMGSYCISFELKDDAADRFRKLTGGNINRNLAIILDGELISAPEIQSEIGASGQITGDFTLEEAKLLANSLNAGALPAPLKDAATEMVAPTVGTDAINSGVYAAVIAFFLVALFMIFYYWRAGFIANVALLLDVILLPASLFLVASILGIFVDNVEGADAKFQLPVLTMPGIAGLVLTLGMAVDANVLIYERIREEFARGANVGKAISAGYGKAFTAIVDSNITTILTGVILFIVGTGPIRGFAIMLTGGVVISMFTAIVVTRLILDYTTDPNSSKPFKMLQFFKNPNFNFMACGGKALLVSLIIIVATVSLFTYRVVKNPRSVLAVDLTGGTSIVYDVDTSKGEVNIAEVREAINGYDNAALIQTVEDGDGQMLSIKTGRVDDDAESQIDACLKKKDISNITLRSSEKIGASVGADLRSSGSKAVVFSLIAILIYIGFRFRFGFALGGIIALAHDALIAFGLFSLCGRQLSLIVITALLTIIGYSINDTVVVFDRIREMLKRDSRTPLKDICNTAINSCLGRTLITSLTTFFSVAVLFIFVDGSIYDFALTMLFGIIAGTYSSVFIATPVMLWWYRNKRPTFDDGDAKSAK